MPLRSLITTALVAAAIGAAATTTFHTPRLAALAHQLGLALPDSMGRGVDDDSTYNYQGHQLRVRTNSLGDVSAIGYRLFDSEWARQHPAREMLDFVERYALEIAMPHPDMDAAERMGLRNRITFVEGTPEMVASIPRATKMDVECINRRGFRLSFTIGGRQLRMAILADYQVIAGADLVELEGIIMRDIMRRNAAATDTLPQPWRTMKPIKAGDVKMYDGGVYLLNMIRSRVYTVADQQGRERVMIDPKRPLASIGNILLTGCAKETVPMNLEVNRYGYLRDTLRTSLQAWIAQCRDEGCKLYVGFKTRTADKATATIFALNSTMGYNHMLSVDVPTSLATGKADRPVKATLYAYIPIHNIVEKYFTYNLTDEMDIK